MESGENVILVQERNLGGKGGAETSNKNILLYLDADWTIVTPHNVPPEIKAQVIKTEKSHKVLSSTARIPTLKELADLRQRFKDLDPKHILFDDPTTYDTLIMLFSVPHQMRDRTSVLWRSILKPQATAIEGNTLLAKAARSSWKLWGKTREMIANRAGMNLCVAPHIAESLIKGGINPKRVKVVGEQVGGEFTPELRKTKTESLRDEYLESDELGVLVASRVSREKGLDWLPKIYETLRSERRFLNPDAAFKKVKITLVGEVMDERGTEYLEELKEKMADESSKTEAFHASESVRFEYKGPQDKDELNSFYNAYDILLMPSPQEGFGRVTVEAMNAGMTVIGNANCEPTKKILAESPYRIGSVAEQPENAAQEILRFMDNPDRLEDLQYNALQWSLGRYDAKTAVDTLSKTFD